MRSLLKTAGILILVAAAAFNAFIYNYHRFQPDVCDWQDDAAAIKLLAFGDPQIRGAQPDDTWRTKIDIMGNDYYLGHVYRMLVPSLKPQHVAVMGDLFSSQWITNEQFHERLDRYTQRIFDPALHKGDLFNITGNHDIGYAGEVTPDRMARYIDAFGLDNFVKTYEVPQPYRIVVLNSLVLDGPMAHVEYRDASWKFLDEVAAADFKGPTILLTHVPLYKPEGICMDGPYFTYYGEEFGSVLREQNHLSEETSQKVLSKVFGPGNPYGGVILTGHDHEGCLTTYTYDTKWEPKTSLVSLPGGVHEITVRSMMAEFGGNAGLLQGTYNGTWQFRYTLCPFALPHWWWAAKVLAILSGGLAAPVLSAMWIGVI